jgi:hypothetical protein
MTAGEPAKEANVGFESFRVELSGGPATLAQANEAVRRLPHVRPDLESGLWPDSQYYAADDGRHLIEIEVSPDPVRVSIRFTLCHPPSVEAALVDIVRQLATQLGMEVRICADVPPPDDLPFSAAQMRQFAEAVRRAAAGPRTEWIAQFGSDQFPASTREVFERVILPRCKPVESALR